MKLPQMVTWGNLFSAPVNGNGKSCVFTSAGCEFFDEEAFNRVLRLERRRSERSGKHFFLVLIGIADHIREQQRIKIMRKLAFVFTEDTRDIDVKGWACKDKVVGMIVTETNGTTPPVLEKALLNKFRSALHESECSKLTISVHVYPEKYDKTDSGKELIDERLYPEIRDREEEKTFSGKVKRLMDIAGSLAGIILFSPFFIVIPILIKLESRGPVFFRQERVGHLGKHFTFLKFRSMRTGNDDSIHKEYVANLIRGEESGESGSGDGDGDKVYKIKSDPRVTRIGRFIRKTSLDELPQFFNVLLGEMSLVGPRPPIPYELETYDIWHRRRVTDIKPGVTGLWQVKGRSRTTFAEMVRLDLQYIRQRSLWMDIKIILLTPLAMVMSRGAY